MSYDKNIENNNNGESQISSIPAANSLIYKFEHGERLKLEQEEKERQRAKFAKKMAKFGEGIAVDQPESNGAVNKKAQMFIDIANKDPQKERAEKERKLEFAKKMQGFQEGSIVPLNDTKVRSINNHWIKCNIIYVNSIY